MASIFVSDLKCSYSHACHSDTWFLSSKVRNNEFIIAPNINITENINHFNDTYQYDSPIDITITERVAWFVVNPDGDSILVSHKLVDVSTSAHYLISDTDCNHSGRVIVSVHFGIYFNSFNGILSGKSIAKLRRWNIRGTT